jgi:NADH-quinone oxidoreductase subunit N
MSFDTKDLLHSLPLIFLSVAGLLLLLLDAFSRTRLLGAAYQKKLPPETSAAVVAPVVGSRAYLMPLTVLALLATLAILAWLPGELGESQGTTLYRDMLVLDRFGLLVSGICVVGALLSVMTAPAFLRAHNIEYGEYYALVIFALVGMVMLIMAADLVTVFLGVETMSLAVYVLTGSWRQNPRSSEAAMKYFLMGAFISGLMVYGIALIYGSIGTTVLAEIHNRATTMAGRPMFYLGWLLLLVSFMFKVAAVPFHMWAPDTYEGAPTPVSGFMMTGIKTAAFAGLLRVFVGGLGGAETALQPYTGWVHTLYVLSILTMTLGNLGALRQDNIKRMLAYSSIAHAGYLLLGVIALAVVGDAARGPLLYYLAAYTLTVVGAMGVVAWLGRDERSASGERLRLEDWAGMGQRNPAAALAMTVFLLSLGGFPPTAGFFGKFYLFRVALEKSSLMPLVLIAIANSLISVFYYLRIITAMYFRNPSATPTTSPLQARELSLAVLIAAVLVLGLGAMPEWLSTLCASATFAPVGR